MDSRAMAPLPQFLLPVHIESILPCLLIMHSSTSHKEPKNVELETLLFPFPFLLNVRSGSYKLNPEISSTVPFPYYAT